MTKEPASESDATPCSGPAWKGPADERDVQGTGVPILAELRARAMQEESEATAMATDAYTKKHKGRFAFASGRVLLASKMIAWIDELCEDQGRDKAGDRRSTSEAVP